MTAAETISIIVQVILVLATMLAGGATVIGYLGRYWWVFDLFSHFRVQYFIILALSATFTLVLNLWILTALAVIFTILNAIAILPLYKRVQRSSNYEGQLRIVMANVLRQNTSYTSVRRLINELSPDFIVLIETSDVWIKEMKPIEAEYPYRFISNREDNYGISLFSRVPAIDSEVITFGDAGVPTIVASFDIRGWILKIICTHPPPPKGRRNSQLRNQQLKEIAEYIAAQDTPVCLCGDLNMTPWSLFFNDLLARSGLIDSGHGFGVQPTWPSAIPIFRVPIDHLLVSPDITVLSRRIGPVIGSDHFPVIMDIAIGKQ